MAAAIGRPAAMPCAPPARIARAACLVALIAAALPGPAWARPPAARAAAQRSAPGCIGEDGSQVDWFAVLKVPNGAGYAYLDPTMDDGDASEWRTVEGKTLDQPEGNAVSDTLQQVYADADGAYAYVQYNDESPEGKRSTAYQGHTKGVWATGEGGGFWLVHSVPRYPAGVSTSGGKYPGLPDNEYKFGQSFLCISMDVEQMDAAAAQFYYNRGMVYDHREVPALSAQLPNFTRYVAGEWSREAVSNTVELTSRSGKFSFTSFAKTHYWDDYLYSKLVADKFDADLLVETWMNGINPDPTFCRGDKDGHEHDVMNVRHVAVADELYGSVDWCVAIRARTRARPPGSGERLTAGSPRARAKQERDAGPQQVVRERAGRPLLRAGRGRGWAEGRLHRRHQPPEEPERPARRHRVHRERDALGRLLQGDRQGRQLLAAEMRPVCCIVGGDGGGVHGVSAVIHYV